MHSLFYTATSVATILISPSFAQEEVPPNPATSSCGVKGYDNSRAYNFQDDGTIASFDGCSAKCAEDATCISFAFGASQCLLYSHDVISNVNEVADSPFTFYDRDCDQDPSSPAPPLSTYAALSSSETVTSYMDVTPTECPPGATTCTALLDEAPIPSQAADFPESEITTITTYYIGICPTGYTTIPHTMTVVTTPGVEQTAVPGSEVPEGFTTTVAVCPQCDSASPTVTLTVPIMSVVPVSIPLDAPAPDIPSTESPYSEIPAEILEQASVETLDEVPAGILSETPAENISEEQVHEESPSSETPGDSPSREHLSEEAPFDETPVGNLSEDQPSEESFPGEFPGENVLEEHAPEQSSYGETLAESPSGEHLSEEALSGETATENPSKDSFSTELPSGEVHGESPSEEHVSKEAFFNETPGESPSEHLSEEALSGETATENLSEEHPSEQSPSDETAAENPSEEYVSGESPSGESDSDEILLEDYSSRGSPSSETPDGNLSEAQPSEDSLADETPAEASSNEHASGESLSSEITSESASGSAGYEPEHAGSEDSELTPPYSISNATTVSFTSEVASTGLSGAENMRPFQFTGAASKVTGAILGAIVAAAVWTASLVV